MSGPPGPRVAEATVCCTARPPACAVPGRPSRCRPPGAGTAS